MSASGRLGEACMDPSCGDIPGVLPAASWLTPPVFVAHGDSCLLFYVHWRWTREVHALTAPSAQPHALTAWSTQPRAAPGVWDPWGLPRERADGGSGWATLIPASELVCHSPYSFWAPFPS